jgi:hypothetical protein
MSDRERTRAAAVLAVVGAIFVVGGLLLTRVPIAILFGLTVAVFGGLALMHAILLGLGVIGWPGDSRERDRDDQR